MRKKGYKLVNNKFIEGKHSEDIIKDIKIAKNELTKNEKGKKIIFSFSDFDSKITSDINEEYNRLVKSFPQNKLRILAMMLLKEHFDYIDKNSNEDDKILALIKNIRTFFEVAFKNDFSKLENFLNEKHIPYDKENISKYTSIRLFLKSDEKLNSFFESLELEQLEILRKELSYINPFTENFYLTYIVIDKLLK